MVKGIISLCSFFQKWKALIFLKQYSFPCKHMHTLVTILIKNAHDIYL